MLASEEKNSAPDSVPLVPDALLLVTATCPHCAAVLQTLGELVKEGQVGRLEVINVAVRPEQAQALGARSVPWIRIGPFELVGSYSRSELLEWVKRVDNPEGMAKYFRHLLATGEMDRVAQLVIRSPEQMDALIILLADSDTDIHVRLGIGAVMEQLQGSQALSIAVDQLGRLTENADARVRGDACHYLALSGNANAVSYIEKLLADESAEVREIAAESLQALN